MHYRLLSTHCCQTPAQSQICAGVIPLLSFIMEQKEYSRALLHYTPTHVHLILMQGERLLLCTIRQTALKQRCISCSLPSPWQLNPKSLSLYITGALKPLHMKQLYVLPSVTVATADNHALPTEAMNLQFGPHFSTYMAGSRPCRFPDCHTNVPPCASSVAF